MLCKFSLKNDLLFWWVYGINKEFHKDAHLSYEIL